MLKRIIAALLGAALLLSLTSCQEKKQSAGKSDDSTAVSSEEPFRIYLNSDCKTYYDPETGTSTRRPDKNGLYHLSLILDGDRVELSCASRTLVTLIDLWPMIGLAVDEDGQISDVIPIYDMPELFVERLFVVSIKNEVIGVHMSYGASSLPLEFTITNKTQIYDISPTAEPFGMPTQLRMMDEVTVFKEDDQSEALYVFITERAMEMPLFWRVDAVYGQPAWDKETKCTTRTPDENGVYTIPMAKDGQLVDVLCKDVELVNRIDSLPVGQQCIGLHINEYGFADNWATARKAINGKLGVTEYDVTQLQANGFSATRTLPGSTQGAVWEGTFSEDCRIYDASGVSGHIGIQVDSLQLGDRVLVFCNWDGEAKLIFITQRSLEN